MCKRFSINKQIDILLKFATAKMTDNLFYRMGNGKNAAYHHFDMKKFDIGEKIIVFCFRSKGNPWLIISIITTHTIWQTSIQFGVY